MNRDFVTLADAAVIGSALVSEIEKASSIDAAASALAARIRPLKDAADWLEHYRRFWEQSFDRLDDYLGELQGKEK